MEPLSNLFCSGAGDAAENQVGTPRSSPPSPTRYPQWGPLRVYRSTPSTNLVPTEDPLCTVGDPNAPDDLLTADTFPSWVRDRRSKMKLDRTSGVETIERAEVVRASSDVTGDSANGRVPKVALLKHTDGQYKIPTTIATPQVSGRTKREALYFHRMSASCSRLNVTFRSHRFSLSYTFHPCVAVLTQSAIRRFELFLGMETPFWPVASSIFGIIRCYERVERRQLRTTIIRVAN